MSSSNTLAMIVVLEMAMAPPAKRLSCCVQPNARPMTKPATIMTATWRTPMTPAVGATRTSFSMLSSSPIANMRRMTPSSESVWTVSGSAFSGSGKCGPTSRPAMM